MDFYQNTDHYENAFLLKDICLRCGTTEDSVIYNCLLGHSFCLNCKKSEECAVCESSLKRNLIPCCFSERGCGRKLLLSEMHFHQINCRFKDVNCPLACALRLSLGDLESHLSNHHKNDFTAGHSCSRKLGRKDSVWAMSCYSTLFKCSFYNFSEYLELVIIHLGPPHLANCFVADLKVLSEKCSLKVRTPCSDWNNASINPSARLNKALLAVNEKNVKLSLKMQILQV